MNVEQVTFPLFVVVDLLGIVGAVLVAAPFFKDDGRKLLVGRLSLPPVPGLEKASQAAREHTQAERDRHDPVDGRYVVWGLLTIAASYLLHIVAEAIVYADRGQA